MSAFVPIAHDDAPSLLIGVTVNLDGLDAALDSVIVRALAGRGFTLFTLNLDHLVKMRKNSRFREAYSAADFVTADGWPVVWMLRRQGYSAERATGADLVEPLCALAGQNGLAVYFIGPSGASQAKALEVLRQRYRGLYVAGAETPDLASHVDEQTVNRLAGRIRESGARLCFVSLGAPKQELLASALRELCPEVGLICVGAGLDFISGYAVRAPQWAQRWHLEWLWRAASDPRRLAFRYFQCATFFGSMLWRGLFDPNAVTIVHGTRHAS
jgi:N-acetylglucosaminyldiphosphoundecaprenol N-acetyl-beta-D-mannosaminyltransferase